MGMWLSLVVPREPGWSKDTQLGLGSDFALPILPIPAHIAEPWGRNFESPEKIEAWAAMGAETSRKIEAWADMGLRHRSLG